MSVRFKIQCFCFDSYFSWETCASLASQLGGSVEGLPIETKTG
ncbi:hypothetical protein [Mesomycoplasma ovipneumoniae]